MTIYAYVFLAIVLVLLRYYDRFLIRFDSSTRNVLRPQLPVIAPVVSSLITFLLVVYTIDSWDEDIAELTITSTLISFVIFYCNLFHKPYLELLSDQIIVRSRFKNERIFKGISSFKIIKFLFFYIIEINSHKIFVFGKLSFKRGDDLCLYCDINQISNYL